MTATVNENCISCGLCAGTCPEVFHMGEDGFAHGSEFGSELLDVAQQARDGCPVSAISIEEYAARISIRPFSSISAKRGRSEIRSGLFFMCCPG